MFVKDRQVRSDMCKLRISAHDLMVEKGRYCYPKVEFDKRYCRFCPRQVENEYHFVFECKLYNTERNIMFNDILKIFPNFTCLDKSEQFIKLLSCTDFELTTIFSKYVSLCFNLRKLARLYKLKYRLFTVS